MKDGFSAAQVKYEKDVAMSDAKAGPSITTGMTEVTPRIGSEGLDEILGLTYPVLNDGFVRCVDYMGSDAAIVRAARVSYGAGTKRVSEDRGLIRFLMRHRHTTPFEHCNIALHIRMPMDAWRQMIRHRMASVNEYSTRYSVAIDSMEKTYPSEWRSQSKKNKQGSAEAITEWPSLGNNPAIKCERTAVGGPVGAPGEYLSDREAELQALAMEVYQERLAMGVAREQARKDLPLSNYTEAYWEIDLHNLFHYLSLRMDAHAQLEIRSYANAIAKIVKAWVPVAYEAFEDYRLNAMFLTRFDTEMLQAIGRTAHDAIDLAGVFGWLVRKDDGTLKTHRERSEFEGKATRLGIDIPWSTS